MEIFENYSTELKLKLKELSKNGKKIAFVPTMGFLHDGHLSLVKQAKKENDIVVVSIFVNEKQFNEESDYNNYPIDLEGDLAKLEKSMVDIVYIPNNQFFYKKPFYTEVNISNVTDKLCGQYRCGHFSGVALVLIKFFNQIKPNKAYFGLKDYQQFLVVKQLVKDLDIDIELCPVDTYREQTGLAMSSRNNRLSNHERANIAPKLYYYLANLAILIKKNPNELISLLEKTKLDLIKAGFTKIDYLEVLSKNLDKFNDINDAQIFAAVFIGDVRLIDNIQIC